MALQSTMQFRKGGRVISPSSMTVSPLRAHHGHPAALYRPGQSTSLIDLPLELRMEVYGYILEEKDPIALKMIKRHGAPREIARTGKQRIKHHRGEIWDSNRRKWVPVAPTHTSILFVDKQVYAEATRILYGNNAFQFDSTTVLKDFLEHLGKRAVFLRSIEIFAGGYVKSSVHSALDLLQQATRLRKLQFGHGNFYPSVYPYRPIIAPEKPASDCKSLLKALRTLYEELKIGADVLDVVSVSKAENCGGCIYGPICWSNCTQAAQDNAALNTKLRALIDGKLNCNERIKADQKVRKSSVEK